MNSPSDVLGGVRGETPWLRRVGEPAALFARRAERLRACAEGHAAGDWLTALSWICEAQARAVRFATATVLPPAGVRPLATAAPWRTDDWTPMLGGLIEALAATRLPEPAREGLAALATTAPERRDRWAGALLAGDDEVPPALAPFLGAALQAWFTARAARLELKDVARGEPGACPACGFAPVAGVVSGDDPVRYLCCGLCSLEWHVTRVQCGLCASTEGISYFALDPGGDGVKAESCAACRAYLKLFYREVRPHAEALADDAATLALDLLLGENGWARGGVNLLTLT